MSERVVQQELQFVRSTKRTHVFETDDDTAGVRSIYVQRSAFGNSEPPTKITVTVTIGLEQLEQGLVVV